ADRQHAQVGRGTHRRRGRAARRSACVTTAATARAPLAAFGARTAARLAALACLALLCSLADARADGLSAQEKERLIDAIGSRLEQSAYTYGVDFATWRERTDEQAQLIQLADTHDDLRDALQRA